MTHTHTHVCADPCTQRTRVQLTCVCTLTCTVCLCVEPQTCSHVCMLTCVHVRTHVSTHTQVCTGTHVNPRPSAPQSPLCTSPSAGAASPPPTPTPGSLPRPTLWPDATVYISQGLRSARGCREGPRMFGFVCYGGGNRTRGPQAPLNIETRCHQLQRPSSPPSSDSTQHSDRPPKLWICCPRGMSRRPLRRNCSTSSGGSPRRRWAGPQAETQTLGSRLATFLATFLINVAKSSLNSSHRPFSAIP